MAPSTNGLPAASWKPLPGERLPTSPQHIFGAALITRANILRYQGISIPEDALHTEPLEDSQIKEYLS